MRDNPKLMMQMLPGDDFEPQPKSKLHKRIDEAKKFLTKTPGAVQPVRNNPLQYQFKHVPKPQKVTSELLPSADKLASSELIKQNI